MLGQFHEISIQTQDMQASLQFYEALGLSQCTTGDTWPHPYAVLTDGHLFLGLHEYRFPSPSLTFVRPGIIAAAREYESAGITLAFTKLSEESFNEFGFRDPCGQMVTLLEARTYFPTERRVQDVTACGDFSAFSLPCDSTDTARPFWEQLGFVALEAADLPYPHLPLTYNGIDIALHRPRFFDQPLLVFTDSTISTRIAALRAAGTEFSPELPRGLDPETHALIAAPEGTLLLLAPES